MITSISGIVAEKSDKSITIEISGVGLSVFVTDMVSAKSSVGENIKLFTHFHVREDLLQLFGFLNANERNFFKNLIKVSGVGPKLAIEILQAPMNQVKKAIVEENVTSLSQIKGLGKKTAQKIILELKSKISFDDELS